MAGTPFPLFPIGKLDNHPHTARPAVGSYSVRIMVESQGVYCLVYRNDVLVTQSRQRDAASAVREARRYVRNARHCGGL